MVLAYGEDDVAVGRIFDLCEGAFLFDPGKFKLVLVTRRVMSIYSGNGEKLHDRRVEWVASLNMKLAKFVAFFLFWRGCGIAIEIFKNLNARLHNFERYFQIAVSF